MSSLASYHRSIVATLDENQQQLVEGREAQILGISRNAWRELRAGVLSLELLRAIHVAATGRPSNVRRAAEDGTWMMVPPKPGKLRSRPQAFRIGAHVEPAWDHNTLKKRIAEILRTATTSVEANPFDSAARTVWSLLRAQPFLGLNERTALLVAARLFHAVGSPLIHIAALVHDDDFATAAVAPNHDNLTDVLERAAWREALDFAEWLRPQPTTQRWSLRDEQEALVSARARMTALDVRELDDVTRYLAGKFGGELAEKLAMSIEPCTIFQPDNEKDRLDAALSAARCGRYVCPPLPLVRLRWLVSSSHGLAARIVIGAAGRGLTGAMSIHLALDLDGVSGRNAPAMLLVPGEDAANRRQRIDDWISRAIPRAILECPLHMQASLVSCDSNTR